MASARIRTSGVTAPGATTNPCVALNLQGEMFLTSRSTTFNMKTQSPTDEADEARSSKSSKPNGAPATRKLDALPTRSPGGHVHRAFVFYGRSGTGKTTVAASFPKPILLLDVSDSGDESVADVTGLEVMDVRSWDDFEIAYWWLKKHPKHYKTLVVDTASQLQIMAIKKVLEDKGKSDERAGEWGVMTKQEWGQVASLMKMWITNLRDLPMEVVIVAQDRVFNVGDEDAAEGLDPEVGPGLSPSIARHLNASFHWIGCTFVRSRTVKVKLKNPPKGKSPYVERSKIEYCMRVGPNPTYITKMRKPKDITPPDVIVDPTYDKLIGIIKGDK